jgi:hypothetical protein
MTPPGPLETLGLTDIETPVFADEPSKYCGAFGGRGDADVALWRQGVRQRFPPSTHYRTTAARLRSVPAANDSPVGEALRLQQIGATRQIERYAGETDEAYCERIASPFATWGRAGTESAIVVQLNAFGLPQVLVFEEYEYSITDSDEYGWKFVVVIGPDYGDLGWTGCVLGSCVLGATTLGMGNATPGQLDAVRRIILKWKQVFSYPISAVFLFQMPFRLALQSLARSYWGRAHKRSSTWATCERSEWRSSVSTLA